MGKRLKFLVTDRVKGKKISLSSTELVDAYATIATDFMSAIFDLGRGDYLITDDSDVLDFSPIDESDTGDIWRRVEAAYGVALLDVNSGGLVNIFKAIANSRKVQ